MSSFVPNFFPTSCLNKRKHNKINANIIFKFTQSFVHIFIKMNTDSDSDPDVWITQDMFSSFQVFQQKMKVYRVSACIISANKCKGGQSSFRCSTGAKPNFYVTEPPNQCTESVHSEPMPMFNLNITAL
jgi:hypothetical protein